MSKLEVAEMFYSVQGEGLSRGKPAVFLRLAGCNLRCGAQGRDLQDVNPLEDDPVDGASWICDSISVWREAEDSYSPEDLYEDFEARGWVDMLTDHSANIVLTGGEPTIRKHQKGFVEFMDCWDVNESNLPIVEVETNGTIKPERDFDDVASRYNVSLKLSNSGHDHEERINPKALEYYANCPRARFKFVVGSEDDIPEIKSLIERWNIRDKDVFLMPAGLNQEQLSETYPVVAELCKENRWKFTGREHIQIWNMATSV